MDNIQLNNTSQLEIVKIRRVFWIWYSDFIALKSLSRHGAWRAGELSLQIGITPLPFNVDVTDWKIAEDTKIDSHGALVGKKIEGLFVKWNEFCESYFNEMVRRPMVVFYEDFDGRTWILGGVNPKTRFSFSKEIDPRNGYRLEFSNISDESSIVVDDATYFPAPPAANSGLPAPSSFFSSIKDRWGLVMPDVELSSSSPDFDFNTFDFSTLALSRETSWGGFNVDLTQSVHDLIAADIWKKIIAWIPNVGGTAGCHRWNFKYPYDDNRAQRLLFTGLTHGVSGLSNFDGFHHAFTFTNVVSFTNSYNMSIGVTLTSNLGSSLGNNKLIFQDIEYTGTGTYFEINIVSGNITYYMQGATAVYSPGAPEPDYTGFRYVVKRDGTELKLFINGLLVQTTTPAFYTSGIAGFTANSTVSFGGSGPIARAAECSIGNIYFASDITDTQTSIIDSIIDTLETAVR